MRAKTWVLENSKKQKMKALLLCEQARDTTEPGAKAELLRTLLNYEDSPEAMPEIYAALRTLNEAPVLNINRQKEIGRWCRYLRSLPSEEAIKMAGPLKDVWRDLTEQAKVEYERLVQWIMFGEQPDQP